MMLVVDEHKLVTGLRISKADAAGVSWSALGGNPAYGAARCEVFVRECEKVSKVLDR
jgi:hypothetical protein